MQPGMTPTVRAEVSSAINDDIDTTLTQAVLHEIQERLGAKRFALWFDGKVRLSISDDCLTVAVGSPFLLNWMQRQFQSELTGAAQSVLGHSAQSRFTVDASLAVARPAAPVQAPPAASSAKSASAPAAKARSASDPVTVVVPAQSVVASATSPLLPSRSRRLADLSDFIPGPQTELALTAARQLASGQQVPFNPLYVCGPVGTGKTHLLEGICRQLKRAQPMANVVLITAEAFGNYFTQALRDHSLPGFRQRFRGVDVLIVDNVEFFESKRVFQEEFLHTITDLTDHGRPIVLSGTRHPRLLNKLSDELVSRFQSGLVCRLEAPDLATRVKIVNAKATRMKGSISPEALQYIAQRFQSNVRELEGALNCLQTYYTMIHKTVTLASAREILADLERDCLRLIRVTDIERVVCSLFGVKPKDLQSMSRVRTLSQPRMLAMFLARKHTPSAYAEIGQHFGGRNHSTVMSAERKVKQWLEQNEKIKVAAQSWSVGELVQTLEQQLMAG
ncbi:chromosomal replication initiator protein DnaA [Schlesneria sp. T3-172]|uniref:chromosomal replication initiator protein DnaA n=2 Tax=Schlesneria TaxID=656899 RepID=UPI0037C9439D